MSELMKNFPTISPGQCVVVMADGATGHVLLHSGALCLNADPTAFQVFDTEISAREYILNRQSNDDTLEFVIYDHREESVAHFYAPRWNM